MEKSKLQRIIIIGLVVLNIGLMLFVFLRPMGKGLHGKRPEPKQIIIKKLHLDKEQIAAYSLLIEKHQAQIKEVMKEQKQLKQNLFGLLDDNELKTDSEAVLLVKIGNNQQEIEKIHFNHFLEIKALCRPDQMADYNLLVKELSELFGMTKPIKRD